MSCRCAPCLVALDDWITFQYPNRDHSSDGCCGDASHQSRKSDHNPNIYGYATALDVDEDIVNGWGNRELWDFSVLLLADSRTKYIIYEGLIMFPDGTVRVYTGINDHTHHLHLSIKAGSEHDMRPWPRIPPFGGQKGSLMASKAITRQGDPAPKTQWVVIGDNLIPVGGLDELSYYVKTGLVLPGYEEWPDNYFDALKQRLNVLPG